MGARLRRFDSCKADQFFMLNDKYIYVFVRQDLTIPQQLVHTNHAVYEMSKAYFNEYIDTWIPAVIAIGTPNEKTLVKVSNKLRGNNIPHFMWKDPEHPELGEFVAIATYPLDLEQKEILKDYRLYKMPL